MESYQAAIMEQASIEVGADIADIAEDSKNWMLDYLDVYIKRHVGRSMGQIEGILENAGVKIEPETVIDNIDERMDEWMEKRPEKIAVEESVRAANAATQFVFWSAGFASVWRIRGAKTCPYCQELNGRAVKSGGMIFKGGEDFEPAGAKNGPMIIRGGLSHPPLHQGCDCYVSHR